MSETKQVEFYLILCRELPLGKNQDDQKQNEPDEISALLKLGTTIVCGSYAPCLVPYFSTTQLRFIPETISPFFYGDNVEKVISGDLIERQDTIINDGDGDDGINRVAYFTREAKTRFGQDTSSSCFVQDFPIRVTLKDLNALVPEAKESREDGSLQHIKLTITGTTITQNNITFSGVSIPKKSLDFLRGTLGYFERISIAKRRERLEREIKILQETRI